MAEVGDVLVVEGIVEAGCQAVELGRGFYFDFLSTEMKISLYLNFKCFVKKIAEFA